MQINGMFIFQHSYFTDIYPEPDVECTIELLMLRGWRGFRGQSKFADDKVTRDTTNAGIWYHKCRL